MSWESYLWPITLYGHDGLKVTESMGKRQLLMDGFPQSGPRYLRTWGKVFDQMDYRPTGNAKILVLGLGGGDVVKILQALNPQCEITAGENNSEMVQIADKYFDVKPSGRLRIKLTDAKKITQTKDRFELVVVDLYSGNAVPGFVTDFKFLESLKSLLTEQGRIVFNYASRWLTARDYDYFEKRVSQIFPTLRRLYIKDHEYMFAATK